MGEGRWERHLARARELARLGRVADAIDAVFRIIAADPQCEPAWIFAAIAYCRQGCAAEVPAMADRYQRFGGRGAILIKEVMNALLREERPDAVEALAGAFPESHAGHILGLYYRGCARMAAGDDQGALALFARFRERADRYVRIIPFLSTPFFNVIYRQGTLVADSAAFASDADPGPPARPGETPAWPAPPTAPAGRPVFVCAANNLYFTQFAGGFVGSVAALGLPAVLHFHVINPDEASRRLMAVLAAGPGDDLAIDFSTAELPAGAGATWFACSRFLAASALLEAYRTPLWLFDIDLLLTAKLAVLVRTLPDPERLDIGLFDTGRHEPASRYCAATVLLNPSPGTGRFLALMERFIRPRLGLPLNANWMLDQAALYSVICHCRQAEPAITIGNFHALTGLGRDDVFVSLNPAEKNAMRWNP
jgi:hypothetical protein